MPSTTGLLREAVLSTAPYSPAFLDRDNREYSSPVSSFARLLFARDYVAPRMPWQHY